MKLLEKLGIYDRASFWAWVVQFIKFGLVGVSNTLVSLGVYYLLVYLGVHYIAANLAGFVLGTLNSYFWHNKYVFQAQKRKHLQALLKTFLAYGGSFLLGTLLLYMMVDVWGLSEYFAPLLNLLVTIPLNFLINKYWAFKS